MSSPSPEAFFTGCLLRLFSAGSLLLALFLAVCSYYLFRDSPRATVPPNLSSPLTPWEELKPGSPARLEGILQGDEIYRSPDSKLPCLAYSLELFQRSHCGEDFEESSVLKRQDGPKTVVFQAAVGSFLCLQSQCLAQTPPLERFSQDLPEFAKGEPIRTPLGYDLTGYRISETLLRTNTNWFVVGIVSTREGKQSVLNAATCYPGTRAEVLSRLQSQSSWSLVLPAVLAFLSVLAALACVACYALGRRECYKAATQSLPTLSNN